MTKRALSAEKDVRDPRVGFVQEESQETQIAEGITLLKVQQRFQDLNERWLKSQACLCLRHEVEERVRQRRDLGQVVDHCIVFGTGTMSGVKAGWTERHDVALTQTAIFKTVANTISRHKNTTLRS
jgi:hypothetical protein